MKRIVNLPLVVIGAAMVLAPLFTHLGMAVLDKERAAEFYRLNPNTAVLPRALEPSHNAGYEWACFSIGVAIAFAGFRDERETSSEKSEKWREAEI